jgi:hypothetical protein
MKEFRVYWDDEEFMFSPCHAEWNRSSERSCCKANQLRVHLKGRSSGKSVQRGAFENKLVYDNGHIDIVVDVTIAIRNVEPLGIATSFQARFLHLHN